MRHATQRHWIDQTARALASATGVVLLALGVAAPLAAAEPAAGSADTLRATHARLESSLAKSAFGAPIHLDSSERGDRLAGDIYAVVDQPFAMVRSGLREADHWCAILILHPNVTNCRSEPVAGANPGTVQIDLGRNGTPVAFAYRVPAAGQDYLHVTLAAPDGPLGTTDYRVDFEATPLDPRRTFVHLVFSHRYGFEARFAMRTYLSTAGRGKVGFTVVDQTPSGQPVYVSDVRGALERNAMRYYVCVEAYLQSLGAPPAQRLETQLNAWHAYTKRYPLQLGEGPDYIAKKRVLAKNLHTAGTDLAAGR